jgi:hypothetical protein
LLVVVVEVVLELVILQQVLAELGDIASTYQDKLLVEEVVQKHHIQYHQVLIQLLLVLVVQVDCKDKVVAELPVLVVVTQTSIQHQ